jgi:hypothetical protein
MKAKIKRVVRRVHRVCGVLGLVFAMLSMGLAGCAGTTSYTVRAITPPDSLLTNCQHAPRPADTTVNGLMLGIIAERAVTESCDWADKAALRAWKAGVEAGQATK